MNKANDSSEGEWVDDDEVSSPDEIIEESDSDEDEFIRLNNQGGRLAQEYEDKGSPRLLDQAIECAQRATTICPDDDPERFRVFGALASHLAARFQLWTRRRDADAAIAAYQTCISARPLDPDRLEFDLEFADLLVDTHIEFGDGSCLIQAINLYEEALKMAPKDCDIMKSLGRAYGFRFSDSCQRDDIERAIGHYDAVMGLSSEDEDYSEASNLRTHAFRCRFEVFQTEPDFASFIQAWCGDIPAISDPNCAGRLVEITRKLVILSELYDHPIYPKRALEYGGQSLQVNKGVDEEAYCTTLIEMGHIHRILAERNENGDEELEEAIKLYEHALGRASELPADRYGRPEDINRALVYGNQALTLQPKNVNSLLCFGTILLAQFQRTGVRDHAEQAINYLEEGKRRAEDNYSLKILAVNNLGGARVGKFQMFGEDQDLREAISNFEEELEASQKDHPGYGSMLLNLSSARLTEFELTGNVEALHRAMALSREVLRLNSSGSPEQTLALMTLGGGYFLRFQHYDEESDINQAVTYYQKAVKACYPGHRDYVQCRSALANALGVRSRCRPNGGNDLQLAIEHAEEAVQDNCIWEKLDALTTLGWLLRGRYEVTGEVGDLNRAIQCLEKTLGDCIEPAPYKLAPVHFDLAESYCFLLSKTRLQQHRDRALDHAQKSAQGDKAPFECRRGKLLANIRSLWMQISPQVDEALAMQEIDEIVQLLENAVQHEPASPQDRFDACMTWINLAKQYKHQSLLQAFQTGIDLLVLSVATARTLSGQQEELRALVANASSLASDAASYALELQEPRLAVELLEQGRTILFGQLYRMRTPIDDLREHHPTEAEEFEDLSRQLQAYVVAGKSGPASSWVLKSLSQQSQLFDDDFTRYHRVLAEWKQTIEKIRRIRGFEYFLKALPFEKLCEAGAKGPVIIVNIADNTSSGSSAIVVYGSSDPGVIPLPRATPLAVGSLSDSLRRIVSEGVSEDDQDAFERRQLRILDILEQVWSHIVGPIVAEIGETLKTLKPPRLWWCPTSSSWGLPLHAATPSQPGDADAASLFISSYTPTLTALLRGRMGFTATATPGTELLVIGQQNTPGQRPLINVPKEIATIKCSFPSILVIDEAKAIKKTVRDGLHKYPWVHFACHGFQDNERPFNSHFALWDETLSLLDILENHHNDAQLAVLSACHSAAGDRDTPDEVIHLAAGLQFIGFRNVIGTLWQSYDPDAPEFAKVFYERMSGPKGRKGGADYSATALAYAVRHLRELGTPLERWILFVHFGG
ncbi:hypothetical protein M407DRAFT_27056 [Tulasnella calospora MUT 4182]|uniref:CHAT domain-containing protein n=1 Tax=Tulasnella calospora MUT 4182 TaxID=1051891 RepID=A0A0C3QEJ8_9AGAM|nr:hypothetical protein M407DRAFT_27056 [Tulasnella calospora MUT 4182]